jgi:hypothetical protein
MCQYLDQVKVTVGQFSAVVAFLENRSLGAVLDRFIMAGRSGEIEALLAMPVFRDHHPFILLGACMTAMRIDDLLSFMALIHHESSADWINRRLWPLRETLLHVAVRETKLWAVSRLCDHDQLDLDAVNTEYQAALDLTEPDSRIFTVILDAIICRRRTQRYQSMPSLMQSRRKLGSLLRLRRPLGAFLRSVRKHGAKIFQSDSKSGTDSITI